MKQNISYFLVFGVILTLGLLSSNSAHGQEEGIPGYELHDPIHPGLNTEEKTLLFDPESRAFKVSRDSTINRPSTSNQKKQADSGKPSGKPKNEEEDPLSFNFLYYIIQKFKVSDLIDQ